MPHKSVPTSELSRAQWRKSTRSNPSGNCVEVAAVAADQVALRNSRDPDGAVQVYPRAVFAAFLSGAKDGELDDLITQ